MSSKPNQNFPVAPVIQDTLTIIQFALKRRKCRLITELSEGITLLGNPHWLSEIITNLVINVIEACKPESGDISIVMKRIEENRLMLQVKDTGNGIKDDNLKWIFDPLFTTKPFGEGTGLGLSIVHNLVDELHGSIEVESKPGETFFTILLPLSKENVPDV